MEWMAYSWTFLVPTITGDINNKQTTVSSNSYLTRRVDQGMFDARQLRNCVFFLFLSNTYDILYFQYPVSDDCVLGDKWGPNSVKIPHHFLLIVTTSTYKYISYPFRDFGSQ